MKLSVFAYYPLAVIFNMNVFKIDKRGRKRKATSLQSTVKFKAKAVIHCLVECNGDKYKAQTFSSGFY